MENIYLIRDYSKNQRNKGGHLLGLSDTTVLAIYCDILKVSISRCFVINYRDTIPVHYCHYRFLQLNSATLQLNSSRLQLSSSLLQLNSSRLQLNSSRLQLNSSVLQLNSSRLQLNSSLLQLNSSLLQLNSSITRMAAGANMKT